MLPEIGSRGEDASPAAVARPGYIGHYVKVVIDGVFEWYGVIPDSDDNRQGLLGSVPTGDVRYNAFGLTWLLEQAKPIRQTKVKTGASTNSVINRAIPFNAGTGDQAKAKGSEWKNYDSTMKCFTDRSKSATPSAWTAANAIE
jgi:hypothetical protein